MGLKLGLSHWGKDVGWGCWEKGYWGQYLGLGGRIDLPGQWRTLQIVELLDFYSSTNIN